MYHIQIGINISSEAKTDFIVNELIPFLEELTLSLSRASIVLIM